MSTIKRYFETNSTDPYYNLAFEEYLLRNETEGDLLMLWQNDNTIVVGKNQDTSAEINQDYVNEHGIRVVRRETGGGAVYHDLGNLNYSFITDTGDSERAARERFTEPVVRALRSLGIPDAEATGRNDITIGGKKVSGTAQRVIGGRILHHGTLLFDSDPSVISGALAADPEKLRARGIRSVRSRVTNIRPHLPEDMTLAAFWQYLKNEFSCGDFSGESYEGPAAAQDPTVTQSGSLSADAPSELPEIRPEILSDEALRKIDALRAEKYATPEWNYGRTVPFDSSRKQRFSGGTLEVRLRTENGIITKIRFLGDFLSLRSTDEIADALEGIRYEKDDVAAVLSRIPLSEYFGSITMVEILLVLFPETACS